MPWKASSVMEEKLRFVFEYELDERSMTELCQRYEIARETGYVWLRRYRQAGAAGLIEHRRAAHRHSNQTPANLEQLVLELRLAHMRTCAGVPGSSSGCSNGTSRGASGRRPAPSG